MFVRYERLPFGAFFQITSSLYKPSCTLHFQLKTRQCHNCIPTIQLIVVAFVCVCVSFNLIYVKWIVNWYSQSLSTHFLRCPSCQPELFLKSLVLKSSILRNCSLLQQWGGILPFWLSYLPQTLPHWECTPLLIDWCTGYANTPRENSRVEMRLMTGNWKRQEVKN